MKKGPGCELEVWICHSNVHTSFQTLLGLEYCKYSCEILVQNGAQIMGGLKTVYCCWSSKIQINKESSSNKMLPVTICDIKLK